MPLPDYITTSNTVGNWREATNNVVNHLNNTSVYILVAQNATPQVSTGNVSINGTMSGTNTTSIIVGNSTANTVISAGSILVDTIPVTTTFFTGVAGENVSVRDVVYIEPTLTAGTAGRAYLMDADVLVKSTQAYFAGFVLTSATAGQDVRIQVDGVVTGFSGLTTGDIYYANSTPGTITSTKPLHPFPVGMAINSTAILINTGNRREKEQSGAVYGYALGGATATSPVSARVATADRITFSTSTTAAHTPANLSVARFYPEGVSDGAVYGYALGGYTGASVVTADRITFSTSTTAAHTPANLSLGRTDHAALSDGSVYGYAVGGATGSGGANRVATADRITFSTSTTAAHTPANLSQARTYLAALSDGAVYGYVVGGTTGASVATADRITFSTSTTAAHTPANLSQARYLLAGLSDGSVYGYAVGGTTGARVATADRITFSTSVTAAHTLADLSQARYGLRGLSDGSVYGYAVGGYTGPSVATADRITFSTGIAAAHTPANLSQSRGDLSGLSDGAV